MPIHICCEVTRSATLLSSNFEIYKKQYNLPLLLERTCLEILLQLGETSNGENAFGSSNNYTNGYNMSGIYTLHEKQKHA